MFDFGAEAKKASKDLRVEKGEKIEVRWTGDVCKAKDNFGNEGFEFKFETNFGIKPMVITAPAQYAKFDNFKKGDVLILDRSVQRPDGKYKFQIYKKDGQTKPAVSSSEDLPF